MKTLIQKLNFKSFSKVILIFLLCMTFFVGVGNVSAGNAPRNGLIAEYLFDGNVNDTSGNGNDGTAVNNPTFISTNYNSGIRLQGNGSFGANGSYVNFPYFNFNSMNSFTINLRVTEYGMTFFHGEGYISFGDSSNGYITIGHYARNIWDNDPPIQFNVGSYSPTGDVQFYPFKGEYLNTPVMYTLKYENGFCHAYINGEYMGSRVQTVSVYGNKGGVGIHRFGTYTNNSTRFSGVIDNLRIYNRALIDTEIQALYNESTPTSSASWRWSCEEQKPATNYGASVVNINGKNAIKLKWNNSIGVNSTTIFKNLSNITSLDSNKNEYIDYNIELGKIYEYFIISKNSCGDEARTRRIIVTYDNSPVFDVSNINSQNNFLSLFVTKYGNFGTENIRVGSYLTNNNGYNVRFQPTLNEQYNYGYLKEGDYHLKTQVEDREGNTYADFKSEQDIKVTYTSSATTDFTLTAEDSGPDYINYKYSVATKNFNYKNTKATIAIIDAENSKNIYETGIIMNTDSKGISNNTLNFKEQYLPANKIFKRQIKLKIGDSNDYLYSNVYDFKVGGLDNFEFKYDKNSKIFSWEKQNNPTLLYTFLCRANDGGTNISKNISNTLNYKDTSKTPIETGNYSCAVSYFRDGYIYKSNEIVFGTNLSLTREQEYKTFMKIFNNGKDLDYDKTAIKLGIIINTSEKTVKVKWTEYANILFKIYGMNKFNEKLYDKQSYNEFAKFLTESIGIEDGLISKEDYKELQDYLTENNNQFKTRVQNVFNYKDEILAFMKSNKSEETKDILRKKIAAYFSLSY